MSTKSKKKGTKRAPKRAAKRVAKVRHPERRERRDVKKVLIRDPVWAAVRDDLVAAFASQELKNMILWATDLPPAVMQRTLKKNLNPEVLRKAIEADIPEADRDYTATHPPCPGGFAHRHYAVLNVAAQNSFEAGVVANPLVAFRHMKLVIDKYLRSRS